MTGPVNQVPRRRLGSLELSPRRVLTFAALVVGLAGLAVVTRNALRDSAEVSMPNGGAIVAALVLTRAALACSARAWVSLLGQSADRVRVMGALYDSQLIKYLPAGGLIQAAGQVGMTTSRELSVQRVSVAFATHAMSSVAAGLAIGAGLVLVDGLHPLVRATALLGVLAPVLVNRPVLAAALRFGRGLTKRIPEPALLPDQRALWTALCWNGANLVLYSAGFTILLRSVSADIPFAEASIAYIVAWVAGFLVLPLPSGVGVREVVLVSLVPAVAAGPLLAASLAQRLVAIAVELTAALTNRLVRAHRRTNAQG